MTSRPELELDVSRPKFVTERLPASRQVGSHRGMDPDLENVIRQALTDAKAAGKDYLSQTELAVRAVQWARPDMTASDRLAAVNLVRYELPPTSTSTALPKCS